VGKTISELILSAKSGSDVHAGDIVVAQVDLAFVQDTTGPLTVRQFRAAKFKKTAESLKAALFLDHAAPSQSREMSTTISCCVNLRSKPAPCSAKSAMASAIRLSPNHWPNPAI